MCEYNNTAIRRSSTVSKIYLISQEKGFLFDGNGLTKFTTFNHSIYGKDRKKIHRL